MGLYNPRLHYFSVLTMIATFGLIIAGGLVTSNDAGLAVPDWPLSFGQVMPEMVGGVFYEHGHRMIASGVGFLTILLCVWLWRSDARSWVRRLGVIALATVIAQGVLGGLTVLLRLPVVVSVLHACLAQAFFCVTVVIAVVTSRRWIGEDLLPRLSRRTAALTMLLTAAVYGQLILGAWLRHAGTVDGAKGVRLVLPALAAHLAGALVVTLLLAVVVIRLLWSEHVRLSQTGYALMGLLSLQLMLGVGAYLARIDALGGAGATARVTVATAHVAIGAALLSVSLWLSLHQAAQHRWSSRLASGGWAEERR